MEEGESVGSGTTTQVKRRDGFGEGIDGAPKPAEQSDAADAALGFIQSNDEQTIADHQKIEQAMRDTLRPEFLNRIDETIIFSPLSLQDVERMINLQMQGIASRLSDNGINLYLTEPARHWLERTGYDPQFGARPLRRAIQRFIENPLSVRMLRGDFTSGNLVFDRHINSTTDYRNISQPTDLVDGQYEWPQQQNVVGTRKPVLKSAGFFAA